MNFDVDLSKAMISARRRFQLAVKFQTDAKRTLLYGPSGAGKTLTLRALAGLLRPDAGVINFRGAKLFDSAMRFEVPTRGRRFGFLFQDYALFPHLNVRQNVAFGLHHGALNASTHTREPTVEHWLARLELTEMASQFPAELSGGQAQRCALARALVNQPRALLLDEPFSALDPSLRERLRRELDKLLSQLDIPVLMITHDPQDLHWFGEHVIHLRDGRVASIGQEPGSESDSLNKETSWPARA